MKTKAQFILNTVSLIFILTLSNIGWSQWQLGDTTIQSVRNVDFPHPNAAYITTDMGLLYKSTDGGISWNVQYDFGVFSSLRHPRFINADTGFVFANSGLKRTFDGGQSWHDIAQGSFYNASSFSVTDDILVISYIDYSNNINYVRKSTDLGDTYTIIFSGPNVNLFNFPVSFIDDMIGYIINPNELEKVYKTTNGGVSFDSILITSGPLVLAGDFEFVDEEHGFIFGNYNGGSRTMGAGTAYTSIDLDGAGNEIVFDLDFNTSRIYAASDSGKIFYSENNSQSWVKQTTPVTGDIVSVAFADENHGIAITSSKVIYTTNGGGFLGLESQTSQPNISIYPNPATNFISIKVGNEIIKSIKMFDLTGKLIKDFAVDGSVLNTQDLNQGAYVLKIETENGFQTKKVIID